MTEGSSLGGKAEAEASAAAKDYVIRVYDDPDAIDATRWNRLLEQQAQPTPFMLHEYLLALHASKSAVPATGWRPQFIVIESQGQLQAACALYLKAHSYGEYVFDWAWADAYQRHGLNYYPKLLGASPFSPVPGSRLLATASRWRVLLIQALRALLQQQTLSSAHVLFVDDTDRQALAQAGWLMREGLQFHWQQDEAMPTRRFEDFLARLQRDKRKKIQQEQRRVADQGVHFEVAAGEQITSELWDFFYRCHSLTYQAHGGRPYLTRDFFARMAQTLPQHWVMFVARRGEERLACSLIAVDESRGSAWGRYWGCVEQLSCLHFDACYYQPLAWCMAQGYQRFEGGAQGEHKMARGLLPVATHSAHWLADQRFANAVAEFLAAEGQGVAAYADELRDRSPFKRKLDTAP